METAALTEPRSPVITGWIPGPGHTVAIVAGMEETFYVAPVTARALLRAGLVERSPIHSPGPLCVLWALPALHVACEALSEALQSRVVPPEDKSPIARLAYAALARTAEGLESAREFRLRYPTWRARRAYHLGESPGCDSHTVCRSGRCCGCSCGE